MKPVYILACGTLSLFASLGKLFGFWSLDWGLVTAPLWIPMVYAYLAFIVIMVHALGTGSLHVVQAPAPLESLAPVVPIAPSGK